MLSVIFRQQHVQTNAECIEFLILFLAWYILEHIGGQFKGYLKFKRLDTSELTQEFTQEHYF